MVSPKPRPSVESERQYVDSNTGLTKPFSSLFEQSKVSLSVIVPAYNEETRIVKMLNETMNYLLARCKKDNKFTFEIIVVDDGSRDNTANVVHDYVRTKGESHFPNEKKYLRLLRFTKNRGKGGAVTQGMLHSAGDLLLFVDADGATRFSDLDSLEIALQKIQKDGFGIAVGSRAHLVTTEAVVKRSCFRNFLMRGFHFYLHLAGIGSVKDTQCGFKLFSRKAAQIIFPSMHVEGWIFDIEILQLANRCGIPVAEVPVTWHEVDGSKMSLLRDSIKMAIDVAMIRLNYTLNLWQPKTLTKLKK